MRYLTRASIYGVLLCLANFGFVYADGPYHGRVIDAATKQPIEGAVVYAEWWTHSPGVVQVVQTFYDAQETLTDKQGNFVIPGMMSPVKDPTAKLQPARFIIFKPEYEAIGRRILTPLPPDVQARNKIKDNVSEDKGIITVELRPIKTEEERKKNLHRIFVSSKVPQEKYKNLVALRNAEKVNLGLNPY